MDIRNLFKAKEKVVTTMAEVLGKDNVKQILSDFIEDHLPDADAIIILWAAHDDVFIDTGGFSEAEALGAMEIGKHMIMDKGIPRR